MDGSGGSTCVRKATALVTRRDRLSDKRSGGEIEEIAADDEASGT